MAQRGSDGDKLNPTHISSSRGPLSLDSRHHQHNNHQLSQQHLSNLDDEDKLLDVVGPPQSPLLSLGQSIQQINPHAHSGKFFLVLAFCQVKIETAYRYNHNYLSLIGKQFLAVVNLIFLQINKKFGKCAVSN